MNARTEMCGCALFMRGNMNGHMRVCRSLCVNKLTGICGCATGNKTVRPVQSIKAWLQQKSHEHGKITKEGQQFVLTYQLMSLIDGLFCIWTQSPEELSSSPDFCKQVLSIEPDVARALLALMNAQEGGVNQAKSVGGESTKMMQERIIIPICHQLSLDLGAAVDAHVSDATPPKLLQRQLQQMYVGDARCEREQVAIVP